MKKLRWRKGIQSVFVTVGVLVLIIVINIFISQKDMSYDVTEEKLYSLSDQTKNILKENKKEIVLYYLASKSEANDTYLSIIKQYPKLSKNIKLEYRDLTNYPNFAEDYLEEGEEIRQDSVIVVSGEKHRYVSSDEYVNYNYDSSYNMIPESLAVESSITAAINYVISEETVKAYTLTGHKEATIPYSLTEGLQDDNYEIEELNLIQEEAVPKDCSVLYINAPTTDLSEEDLKKLKDYMKKGGKMYIVLDALEEQLPNLFQLTEEYGITVEEGIVAEGDSGHYMQQYPTYLLPQINHSEVTKDLMDHTNILLPLAKGFTIKEDTGKYTVTSLLSTSEKAYSKVDMNSSVIEKQKGDLEGPFELAVMSSDSSGGRMIVFGCTNALVEQIDNAVSKGNSNFVLNGFNYLTKQESKISVRAKELTEEYAIVPAFWQKTVMMFSIFVIPVMLLLIGGFIVRRRKRL